MVFFYKSCVEGFLMYMGRDKYENDEMLEHCLPTDVWFHVSDLSSAHVYLRLPSRDVDVDSIPEEVMEECTQLVKHNSIEGCKKASVKVTYTMTTNLRKAKNMDVGQVGFHNNKAIRYASNVEKKKDVVKRLIKTEVERETSVLAEMKEAWEKKQRRREKEEKRKKAAELEELHKQRQAEKELRSYKGVMDNDEEMVSNKDVGKSVEEYEDDFM